MAEITVADLTGGDVDGNGVFDVLMGAVNSHLQQEYAKGRIKGSDYAKVYLGSIQESMGQAIQFTLTKQQSDKQADLLAAQILQTAAETTLTENRTLLTQQEITNKTIEGQVLINEAAIKEQQILVAQQEVLNMEQQVLKSAAEVSLLGKQEEKIDADIVIAQQQLTTMASEIALINARKDLVDAQVLSEASQRLKIDAEISLLGVEESKISQEIALMVQRVTNLASEKLKIDAETALLTARLTTETNQATLIANQANKILAEIDLITEKKWTERAQYLDTTGSPSATVAGVIGKQKELYEAQKDGFTRDAEQKAAKIMVDSWNVRKSADPDGTFTNANKLDDSNIAVTMTKLIQGIGGTVV